MAGTRAYIIGGNVLGVVLLSWVSWMVLRSCQRRWGARLALSVTPAGLTSTRRDTCNGSKGGVLSAVHGGESARYAFKNELPGDLAMSTRFIAELDGGERSWSTMKRSGQSS